ncbi:MAG: hypothetical protein R3C59_02195 [Planctomycetaceae bacterium]
MKELQETGKPLSLVAAAKQKATKRETIDHASTSREVTAPLSDASDLRINLQTMFMAHPVAAIAAGFAIFLMAFLFPPELYTSLLIDKCYMFLDFRMLAYNSVCVILLLGGLYVSFGGSLSGPPPNMRPESSYNRFPLTVGGLLFAIIILNMTSAYLVIRVGGLSSMLSAMRGNVLLGQEMERFSEEAGGERWKALLNVSAIALPAAWHFSRGFRKYSFVWWLMIGCLATYFPAAVLTAKRNFLIRPVFGMLLIFFVWPVGRKLYSRQKAVGLCVCLGMIVIAAFLGLSVIRKGIQGTTEASGEVVRYVLGSYNTESLIVSGEMEVPGSRRGYYWTQWFWEFPVLSRMLRLDMLREKLLGDKAPYGHLQRAPMLEQHGLTISTAIPAFACTFVDFGWLGPLAFFPLGLVAGLIWKSFLRQNPTGLILYPHAAYAFVEIRGNLLFPSYHTGNCILILWAILACLWMEGGRKRNTTSRPASASRSQSGLLPRSL